ncbi:MAG TPA: hypothetical protein VFM06_05035 [Candidatus Limnocylindria bacterium]|nr:hypothetical protein [Candidatus Limnocylindria bacterium]
MTAARWIAATTLGFVLTGMALHSPGASSVGNAYYEWDMSAALFGAILGALAGLVTGGLRLLAIRARSLRLLLATVAAVAVGHALADGAPSVWGVPIVAALGGLAAAAAHAWATRERDVRLMALIALAWTAGWLGGVALAGALGLSGGADPGAWAAEHAVIAAAIGIAFGAATAPAARRILGGTRALSSVG